MATRHVIEEGIVYEENISRKPIGMADVYKHTHNILNRIIIIPGWAPRSAITVDNQMVTWYQVRDFFPVNAAWVMRENPEPGTPLLVPNFLFARDREDERDGLDFNPGFEFRIPNAKFVLRVACTLTGLPGQTCIFAVPTYNHDMFYHPCIPNVWGPNGEEGDNSVGTLCFGDQPGPDTRLGSVGLEKYAHDTIDAWLAGKWNSDLFLNMPNLGDVQTWMQYNSKTNEQIPLPDKYDWESQGWSLVKTTKAEKEVLKNVLGQV